MEQIAEYSIVYRAGCTRAGTGGESHATASAIRPVPPMWGTEQKG